MKKRIFAVLLSLCLILNLLPAGVLAAGPTSGKCGENLTWTLEDGILTVSGTGPMTDFSDGTAPWKDTITEVRIEKGVTTIGDYAFWLCSDLTKVTLPDGVTFIGDSAFFSCNNLKTIELPASVTTIGLSAFALCQTLNGLTLPASVTDIGSHAFWYCSNLTGVTIPTNITKIGDKAFGYVRNQNGNEVLKEGFTITGYSGTAAETYAKENNIPFTSLGSVITFADVPAGEYYAGAVNWAVSKNITNGTGENDAKQPLFSPMEACTRAHAVTFLWRAAGSPRPGSAKTSFVDIVKGEYYYDAVLWAVEKGITTGTDTTHFSPNKTCSRAEIVTFLHRYEGSPNVTGSGFNDVSKNAYYYIPVLWAVSKGVTNGTDPANNLFSPMENCTRGQIVTFLYRNMVGSV